MNHNTDTRPDFPPTFNPAYRTSRCGQLSAHGPHVVEHGPDQPRNCPGYDPRPMDSRPSDHTGGA